MPPTPGWTDKLQHLIWSFFGFTDGSLHQNICSKKSNFLKFSNFNFYDVSANSTILETRNEESIWIDISIIKKTL